jgi:hypothetical protein
MGGDPVFIAKRGDNMAVCNEEMWLFEEGGSTIKCRKYSITFTAVVFREKHENNFF